MNSATIVALLNALLGLAPEVPALIAGVKVAVDLVTSGRAPSAAEQAQIDAALDAAHEALQNAKPAAS